MNATFRQKVPFTGSLETLYEHLARLLAVHEAAGKSVAVEFRDSTGRLEWLRSVLLSRDGRRVTIGYGRGLRGNWSTSFSAGEGGTFRFRLGGFFGYDEGGQWVRVSGSPDVMGVGELRRDVVRAGPAGGGRGKESAPVEGPPLVDGAVARALVFTPALLGRRADLGGPWQITTELGSARSAQGRMWQEQRGALEYLVSEAVKHGRRLLVPAVKMMTAMTMRLTEGSVPYGKAAMERMRDTVIQVASGDPSDSATWHDLRLIEHVEWREDGGVEVTLTPEAIRTFRPATTKAIRKLLGKWNREYWWESWLAGFAATGKGVTIARQDLELLAGESNAAEAQLWRRLTEVVSADDLRTSLIWYDRRFVMAACDLYNRRCHDVIRGRGATRSLEELTVEFNAQRKRMQAVVDGGGFVTGASESVSWRRVGTERLEIVCFEQSGLERREQDEAVHAEEFL